MRKISPPTLYLMLLVLMMTFFVPEHSLAGEDRRWHATGMALVAEMEELLIEHGQCASASECTKKGKVLFRSTKDGLEVSLYETVDPNIVSLVLAKMATRLVTEGMQEIELKIFASTKAVELQRAGLFGEKPIMIFSIDGKYHASNR